MPRNETETKAIRFLTQGDLIVTSVKGDLVTAFCRGLHAVYSLGYEPDRGWHCDCPARIRCSHIAALQTVTIRRYPRRPPLPGATELQERST